MKDNKQLQTLRLHNICLHMKDNKQVQTFRLHNICQHNEDSKQVHNRQGLINLFYKCRDCRGLSVAQCHVAKRE